MKKFALIYFIFLSVNPFNCSPTDVKIQSVKLDKIIIPIMYDVSNHNFDKAYNTSLVLMDEWELYKDMDWGETEAFVHDMEQRISSLPTAIQQQQGTKALGIIEDIQCSLSEWRADQNFDYYLDDWFKFKYDVDEFSSISEDILLDLCEWEELEWHFQNISASFYFLNVYPYDLEYFELNNDIFERQLFNINTAIMDLSVAMESAERENVERQAYILQTNVRNTIYMLGDCQQSFAGL